MSDDEWLEPRPANAALREFVRRGLSVTAPPPKEPPHTEMVERVAKAQFANAYAVAAGPGDDWEALSGDERALWLKAARVGIEALREPTDGMFNAGEKAATRYSDRWMMSITDEVWTAMIDAALTPTQGSET